MVVFPNAKINLGLDVVRRRPDGYHDISTVMAPIGWCDILEIVPAKGRHTSLTTSGRAVNCKPDKNLVIRAYNALLAHAHVPPVDIYLRKIIPDGAGLGGGSSDAAFTLKTLNDLFGLGIPTPELAAIASSIGADCPFFIYNRPMLATGTGTDLTPIDTGNLNGTHIVVIKPDIHISTAEAYSNIIPQKPATDIQDIIGLPLNGWKNLLKNDFEKSIATNHPEISQIKSRLYELGAVYASMSGSGSAVYGVFDNDILAETALQSFPHCVTFRGKLQ